MYFAKESDVFSQRVYITLFETLMQEENLDLRDELNGVINKAWKVLTEGESMATVSNEHYLLTSILVDHKLGGLKESDIKNIDMHTYEVIIDILKKSKIASD